MHFQTKISQITMYFQSKIQKMIFKVQFVLYSTKLALL